VLDNLPALRAIMKPINERYLDVQQDVLETYLDGVFRSKDLHARAARALGKTTESDKSSQLRYDLSKLRAKDLVQKVQGTQGYRLTDEAYRMCLCFLKVHQRLLAPMTSATHGLLMSWARVNFRHGLPPLQALSVQRATRKANRQFATGAAIPTRR